MKTQPDLFNESEPPAKRPRVATNKTTTVDDLPALTRIQRRMIQTGTDILLDRPGPLTYQHTVLCQTAMPYQAQRVRHWERRNGRVRLQIEAGHVLDPTDDEYVPVPLPHGAKARVILMHLNAEALRTGSPAVEVVGSLTAFVRRILGYAPNGREIGAFRSQLTSLAASHVRLAMVDPDRARAIQINTQVITAMDLWAPDHPDQRVMWPSVIRLSTEYFESLMAHAVPLDERAIGALAHSAMALDLYAWLAQRLHRIPPGRPQLVPWPLLHEQFGAGYTRIRDFRPFLARQLDAVRSQYGKARVEVDTKGRGLWVRYSPPPVARRAFTMSLKSGSNE